MPLNRRRRHSNNSEEDESELIPDETDSYTRINQKSTYTTQKVPWKTIFFVIFFLSIGSICLTIAILTFMEVLDQKYADRVTPLLMLGTLMLIPGGYYGYVLACISLKCRDYSWDDVPVL